MGSNQEVMKISTFGVASCFGGSNGTCANAPYVIRASAYKDCLTTKNIELNWKSVVSPKNCTTNSLSCLSELSYDIASLTYQHTLNNIMGRQLGTPFLVISGDHSSAIGTWAGVIQGLKGKTLGLIWIDAHLDAHRLATSPTGNLHGMPVAVLLNKAEPTLQATYPVIGNEQTAEVPHLNGENLSLLGIRSYEPPELELLKNENAHVFKMQHLMHADNPVAQLNTMAADLLARCDVIGISLDVDAINPEDAPAVETPEKNGIKGEMLIKMLSEFSYKDKLVGLEISEFSPADDVQMKTEKLINRLISATFSKV
ncbi:MAG: arginase family protein [Pseudomonadales bacterium]|nr:arginase family protein [Pseudomonadales bacterium]